jgi:hypothetical protein
MRQVYPRVGIQLFPDFFGNVGVCNISVGADSKVVYYLLYTGEPDRKSVV